MLPASNRGIGMSLCFPDVCVTPVGPVPTPIPYPNMAMNAAMVPFSPRVYLGFVNALNMMSMAPMTLGDQAGSLSPFMGPGRYTMGNPIVHVDGLPAISMLCPTSGNNFIAMLGAVLIASILNVFYSLAGEPPAGEGLSREDLRRLQRALDPARSTEEGTLLAGGFGYLPVPVLSLDVPARVFSAVRRFEERGLAALVLDLRDNPGGDVTAFLELASDFLEPGTHLCTMTDAEGDDAVHRSRRERPYRHPLFVLVNRGTASAAELFAGCMKAHGRAVIVGETTHGKGTAQVVVPRAGGSGAEYAAAARFTLPGNTPLDGSGVCPDLVLPV